MYGRSLEAQFLDQAGDSFLGTIENQDFKDDSERGAPPIHVADLRFATEDDPKISPEAVEGFFVLQQGEDTILISKQQIEKLVDLTK